MADPTSPEAVVQRQLDAYNAHDLEGWLAVYAEDAKQFELPDKVLATGRAEMRARGVERFADPEVHAKLIRRTVLGNVVVDHEHFRRTYPEGPKTMELLCVYVVEDGLIRSASFVYGAPVAERKG